MKIYAPLEEYVVDKPKEGALPSATPPQRHRTRRLALARIDSPFVNEGSAWLLFTRTSSLNTTLLCIETLFVRRFEPYLKCQHPSPLDYEHFV
jgi:hypothetical protein